jgi:hypothetical protein
MLNFQSLLAQQSVNTTRTLEIPSLVDELWTIVMDDRIYQSMSFLGTLMAVFVMCIWCVQMYKTLKKGGSRPKVKEIIFPLILIVLLFNDGGNMKDLTFGTKNDVNIFKTPVNKVVVEDGLMIQSTGDELSESELSATDALIKSYIQVEKNRYQSSFW